MKKIKILMINATCVGKLSYSNNVVAIWFRQDFDRKADAKSAKHGGFRYHIKVLSFFL